MNQNPDMKKLWENIEIPLELDARIKKAIEKGSKTKRNASVQKKLLGMVACLMLVFTLSVNTVPAFAQSISQIPVISWLSELVRFDKGLVSAVNHDFIKHENLSVRDQNIEFSINGVLLDEERINLIYSLKMAEEYKEFTGIKIWQYSIIDENSNVLYGMTEASQAAQSTGPQWLTFCYDQTTRQDFTESNISQGVIEMLKNNTTAALPQKIKIIITQLQGLKYTDETDRILMEGNITPEKMKKIVESNEIFVDGRWIIEIPLQNVTTIEPIVYNLQQTIEKQGLRMAVKEVKIFPTATVVKYKADGTKEKPFGEYTYIRLQIEDGKGNIFGLNRDTRNPKSGEITAYLESCYFDKPADLWLVGIGERFDPKQNQVRNEEIFRVDLKEVNIK